jgi:DNA-binding CsgD family transcriptional regulator
MGFIVVRYRFTQEDVAVILRLVAEISATAPLLPLRMERILAGLCGALQVDSAVVAENETGRAARPRCLIRWPTSRPVDLRGVPMTVGPAAHMRAGPAVGVLTSRYDHLIREGCVGYVLEMRGADYHRRQERTVVSSTIRERRRIWTVLYRADSSSPFSPRDVAIAGAILESPWWLPSDTARDSNATVSLPPRARDVLALLKAGYREKQAALQLGIKPGTLHDYVKMLYSHFGVSSRAELLVRLLTAADSSGTTGIAPTDPIDQLTSR